MDELNEKMVEAVAENSEAIAKVAKQYSAKVVAAVGMGCAAVGAGAMYLWDHRPIRKLKKVAKANEEKAKADTENAVDVEFKETEK